MREGALGVGSALIYSPATYAKTDELIAITKAAGEFGGAYISHMRSEGDRLLESLDELIRIAREAHVHGEVYHFKAAGKSNWPKMSASYREDRRRAQKRRRHFREHVHLHRWRDGSGRRDATVGAGRRRRCVDQTVCRIRRSARASSRKCASRARTGKIFCSPPVSRQRPARRVRQARH